MEAGQLITTRYLGAIKGLYALISGFLIYGLSILAIENPWKWQNLLYFLPFSLVVAFMLLFIFLARNIVACPDGIVLGDHVIPWKHLQKVTAYKSNSPICVIRTKNQKTLITMPSQEGLHVLWSMWRTHEPEAEIKIRDGYLIKTWERKVNGQP